MLMAALLLYALNKFTPAFSFLPFDFARNHLNDVLAGVFLPAYANLVASCSRARKLLVVDTLPRILMLLLACSIVWEVLAPLVLPFSVGDALDVVAYLSGGVVYWAARRALSGPYRPREIVRRSTKSALRSEEARTS